MLPNIKVMLRKDKPTKQGLLPIIFRITQQGVRYYYYTNHALSPDFWNEQEGSVHKAHPNHKVITEELTQTWLKLTRMFNDGLHPKEAIERLKNPERPLDAAATSTLSRTTPLFYQYIAEHVQKLKDANKLGYALSFQSTINALKRYHEHDLRAEKVDHRFLESFETYHLKNGLTLNGIFVYMRNIKVICNLMRKRGDMPYSWYPFRTFTFSHYNKIITKKRALKEEEWERFVQYQPITNQQQLAHDLSLFSYYCRGMNLVDIIQLKPHQIEGERMWYIRTKTSKRFEMQLLPPALKVLERYKHKATDTGYVFGVLNQHKHITPQQILDRKHKIDKQINSALKEIGKELGINNLQSFYDIRHTCATILKRRGVSIAKISEMYGHGTEKTTQIYLKAFENDELDEAAQVLL